MSAQLDSALDRLRALVPMTAELTSDSRRLNQGDVFLAYPGARSDGRNFIGDVLARGAAAVLFENGDGFDAYDQAQRLIGVSALKAYAGEIAAAWYRDPGTALLSVGVTGTSGKTSSTLWICQALAALGRRPVFIGTLGIGFLSELSETGLTTPDPVELHRSLRHLADGGADALAMEVSSIGLVEGRARGMHFDIALFTNLSHDHLDYHGSMQEYEKAKAELFAWPGLQYAVANLDDPAGARMLDVARESGAKVFGFALGPQPADLSGSITQISGDGMRLEVRGEFGQRVVDTSLVGAYNASNLLGVLAVLLCAGFEVDAAIKVLSLLRPAPGRLERVAARSGPMTLIDYAHKPDALEKVLLACQPLAASRQGRLWVVFGCGGDRDAVKRPMMGAIAARLADQVILTSDNPRSENPEAIIASIARGIPDTKTEVKRITDRREAIAFAVGAAQEHDVILIAGKGHEDYQEVMGVKSTFSDRSEAVRALKARNGRRP